MTKKIIKTIKKHYVEIEILDEEIDETKENENKENVIKEMAEEDLKLEKNLEIPLEKLEKNEILTDIGLRLGKMRVQDIAFDLDINIPTIRKYRKEILSKLSEKQRVIIISQEKKIERLRLKILSGKMKRRPHNYSYGIEGLVRGIVRDLTKQGKSIRQIVEQTNLETSTVSYHREKIKNRKKRKIPPRIMNMKPNKDEIVKKLLKRNKRQKDICNILDISSATASVIVNKIKEENITELKD